MPGLPLAAAKQVQLDDATDAPAAAATAAAAVAEQVPSSSAAVPAATAAATAGAVAAAPILTDVLVIGAGVAGLKAAADLSAAGVVGAISKLPLSVTVLEASSRTLGRVATLPNGTNGWPIPIELGGQWLHGINNNVLYPIATAAGLPVVSTGNGNDWLVYNETAKVPATKSDPWWTLQGEFDPTFLDNFRNARWSNATKMGLNTAVEAFMTSKGMDAATRQGFLSTIESEYVQEYAASTDRLNLAYFDADSAYSGPDAIITGQRGMSSLFAPTLAAVKDLRLNTTVTRITWTAKAGSIGERLLVNATTAGGAPVSFAPRFVICTLPLGVLQAQLATLFPGTVGTSTGLTANKVTAINTLGMGVYDKVIMHFSSAFWATSANAGSNQWIDRFATNASQPNEFFSLYQSTGKPVLVAFFAGTPAAANEATDDATTLANVLTSLRKMFGAANVPAPLRYVITRWASNPYSYGSYSYVPVGAAGNARTRLGLAEANNTLHFAGEATRTDFPSTIHGAWLSGAAAAKAVLARA